MKEQYQREIAQIHVPTELLKKTKQAMQAEESRLRQSNVQSKVHSFRTLTLAAAAVLLVLLVYPTATSFLRSKNKEEMQTPQMQGVQAQEMQQAQVQESQIQALQIQLAGQTQPEIAPIAKGEAVLTEETAAEMPEVFATGEECEINGVKALIVADEATGYYQAYLQEAESGLLVTSKITDKEEFLRELQNR